MEKLFWTKWDWTIWEWHHAPWLFALVPAVLATAWIVTKVRGR